VITSDQIPLQTLSLNIEDSWSGLTPFAHRYYKSLSLLWWLFMLEMRNVSKTPAFLEQGVSFFMFPFSLQHVFFWKVFVSTLVWKIPFVPLCKNKCYNHKLSFASFSSMLGVSSIVSSSVIHQSNYEFNLDLYATIVLVCEFLST